MRFVLVLILLIYSGCTLRPDGIYYGYYPDCKEYYDINGIYHKECKNKILGTEE